MTVIHLKYSSKSVKDVFGNCVTEGHAKIVKINLKWEILIKSTFKIKTQSII